MLLIAALVIATIAFFFQGYVGMVLWNWTIAPLGLPILAYWQSFALLLTVKYWTHQWSPIKADTSDEASALMHSMVGLGYPALVLLIVWLVK